MTSVKAALEQTRQEIPAEHAVVILLRAAAEAEPDEVEERLAA